MKRAALIPAKTPASGVTAPGAPTIGTAVASTGQVSVAFTAPGSTGGAAITSYTATGALTGASASSAASPIVVPMPLSGFTEAFSVVATNAELLTSAPSALSNTVSQGSTGPVASLRQVVSRGGYNTQKIGAPQAEGSTTVQAWDNISGLGVTIINAYNQLEQDPGAPTTYKVVYEYNGQLATIIWDTTKGSSTAGTTATATGAIRIDSTYTPFGFTIPKGAFFRRRIYTTCSAGCMVSRGSAVARTLDASIDRFNFSNQASPSIDNTGLSKAAWDALGTQLYSNGADYALKLAAEWSMSTVEAYALEGDSRMIGATGDLPSAPTYAMEHGERLVAVAGPFSNFGASNEKGLDWASGANGALRKSVIGDFFQVRLFGYGTNDLGNSTSAQYMWDIAKAAKLLPHGVGKKFYGTNLPPRLSAQPVDYYTTYTGQSLATGDANRNGYNAMMAANADGTFDRVFDECQFVQDATTGKVKIYANARSVAANASIDQTTGLITANPGTFLPADDGHNVFATGWAFNEQGGALTYGRAGRAQMLKYVSDTQAYCVNIVGSVLKPAASVTGQTLLFGANDPSTDGIHFTQRVLEPLSTIAIQPYQ